MNESSSSYQSDEAAFMLGQPNGQTSALAGNPPALLARSDDELDAPSLAAAFARPMQARAGKPAGVNEALISEESMGEAPISVAGVESMQDSAELNAEIGNPAGQESGEEGYYEATPAQLQAASGEEAAFTGEEAFFDNSAEAGAAIEAGELREVGAAAEGQEAGAQEEFFPLLASLIPTLASTVGPALARQVVQALSPRARQGIKRLAAAVPKAAPGKSPVKNVISMFAKMLEAASAQDLPGGESGAELGEEMGAVVTEVAASIEVIIGTDDRSLIRNTAADPWRRICLLRITFPNGKVYRGTGFLIGPRTVATAGHCVYLQDQGGWARRIEVSPGASGNIRPYGTAVSTTFRSVAGWVNNRKPECDYGCIVLPAGAFNGRNLGRFGLAAMDGPQLLAKPAVLSGYPGDKPMEMWGMGRRIKTVTEKTLVYDIDTVGGQSGAPVYIKANGQRYVVGIHNYGNASGNSATRVTPLVYERLKQWSAL